MESINKAKVCSLIINKIDKLLVKIDKRMNKLKGGKEGKKQKREAAQISNTGFEKDNKRCNSLAGNAQQLSTDLWSRRDCGSVPRQGMCLGCGLDMQEAADQ